MIGLDIENGSDSSLTDIVLPESLPSIALRVGSASAEKTRSSVLIPLLTIWLTMESSDALQPQFCLIKTFTRIELARPANLVVAWVGLWSGLQSSAFRRNHVGEMNYGVLILATVITGKMLVKDTWGPVRCGGRMVDR